MFMNKMSKKAKPKIQLKKLKELDNKLWHPDSTLVFNDDKKVIGRFENGDLVVLDDVSIELCVKWGFKYEESLLEDGTEEEEGSEEQPEGEEEEGEAEEAEEAEEEEEEAEEETEEQDSDEQEVHKPIIVEKSKKVEEQKKIIKEEVKIKQVESENENETYVTDLTRDFSNKLNTFFDEFRIKNNMKITNLQNDLIQKENELKELTERYENEIKNHNDLKNKFNAVKSLFSV